ncbi:hypothetical protein [Streptomyces sp. CC228A]|uniref:hypothetical protein n=1 Tax=Streptomyces sp. CC228A TaxID=2898186 RepID=UPI001F48074B|nr:hypothetical protein [Streptomyces sp. CC228A]
MPRSIFLGRPMPGPGEPLWLEDDRAWAYALHTVEADRCPDCRQPWGEATDPDSEGTWRAEVIRCHSCATAAAAVGRFEKDGGDTRGLHVHVRRG